MKLFIQVMTVTGDKSVSNIARLFGMFIANKAVERYKMPTHMMGLTQIAAEEFWDQTTSYNLTELYSRVSSGFGSGSGSGHGLGFGLGSLSGLNITGMIGSYQLDMNYLFWIAMIVCLILVLRKLPYYARSMGLTDNVYTSMAQHYYQRKLGKNYTSLIMDPGEQSTIVNDHIMKHGLFCTDYDRFRYFFHEYDVLPNNHHSFDLERYKNIFIPCLNRRFYFRDHYFQVHGYIRWSSKEITINVTKKSARSNDKGDTSVTEDTSMKTRIPILEMVINKPIDSYISDITKMDKMQEKVQNTYFCHITQGNVSDKLYAKVMSSYTHKGDDWKEYFKKHYSEKEKKHWIDTFFHPCKHQIWPKLWNIHFEPEAICAMGQYPQASYCLYGPPGTGKSTMVFRVAKALGRGIISVNICGIKTALELRKIINGIYLQPISLMNDKNNININSSPRFMVLVFDEFDKAILALKAKSDLKAKKEHQKMKQVMNAGYKGGILRFPGSPGSFLDEDPKEIGAIPAPAPLLLPEGPDDPNEKQQDDKLKQAINDLTQMEDDDLTVDSLLDIIQGPCDNPGAIIFAITNKYEQIRDICPRLFRDGRFKPIYFGYPSKETLEEITQHYYGKSIMNIDWIPQVIRISTARITNRAVDIHYAYPNDKTKQFQVFLDNLKFDLENYKLSDKFVEYEGCQDTDLHSS